MAPLVELAEDSADDSTDDADGTELDEGLTGEVADEVAPVLLRAALRSFGNIKGVDPAEPRFTVPSC